MMQTYVRLVSNKVWEIIQVPDGLSIEQMFTAEFVLDCVEITGLDPQPQQDWTYADGKFEEPLEIVLTAAEVLSRNTSTRDYLMAQAAAAIAPLQDAVDLDEATAAEAAALKKWKQYRVAVNRIDLTQIAPAWPSQP
jgi:hypothetical protein